jgi:hypothetical protein
MSPGLVIAWTDFGRRTAVLAGMGVALISLVQHCPLWVASARGAATIVVLALIVQLVTRLLVWSNAGDRDESLAKLAASGDRARAEKKERK